MENASTVNKIMLGNTISLLNLVFKHIDGSNINDNSCIKIIMLPY